MAKEVLFRYRDILGSQSGFKGGEEVVICGVILEAGR
jgi:hypothetical protein